MSVSSVSAVTVFMTDLERTLSQNRREWVTEQLLAVRRRELVEEIRPHLGQVRRRFVDVNELRAYVSDDTFLGHSSPIFLDGKVSPSFAIKLLVIVGTPVLNHFLTLKAMASCKHKASTV